MEFTDSTFEFQQDNLRRQLEFERFQQDSLYFEVEARTDLQSLSDLIFQVVESVGRQDELLSDHSFGLLAAQRHG